MDSINTFKAVFAIIFITIICVPLNSTTCLRMNISLYCTNLGNDTDDIVLTFETDDDQQEKDVQMVFIQSSSGSINEDTFSTLPNMKSLDVQFSNISQFLPKASTMNILYLMNNLKFPNLSTDFMNRCCQNVSTLIIKNNHELQIDTGVFKHMTSLTHLTISQQNITNLTEEFFDGLEKLSYLNLEEDGISTIKENTFHKLTNMNHLILSKNYLTKLEPNTFEKLKVLETIEIYNINFIEFNISIFNNQKELKMLGIPKSLIKMHDMKLSEFSRTLPKLEYFGFCNKDSEDADVSEFIKKCRASGYKIRYI